MRRTSWMFGAATAAGAALCALFSGGPVGSAGARDEFRDLQKQLKDENLIGDWIYDDVDAAFAVAVRSKRPLMIVFR